MGLDGMERKDEMHRRCWRWQDVMGRHMIRYLLEGNVDFDSCSRVLKPVAALA